MTDNASRLRQLSLKPDLITSIPLIRTKSKVWVEGYGCSANLADTEMIKGIVAASGHALAESEAESSLNVIVTCSVKDTTEHKMAYRIRHMSQTQKPLVIAGCLPKADRSLVERLSASASLIGPHSIDKTAEVVQSALRGRKAVFLQDSGVPKLGLPKIRVNPVIGIVEIASGCLSNCTFCQTKLAKGTLNSYRIGDIVRQIKTELSQGCKEIWLTSTDCGCYGHEYGVDLADLLQECVSIHGDFRIRIGMMNPMYLHAMIGKLERILQTSDKVFKFLHIPVQSGSDSILRKMGRGHTAARFAGHVARLRRAIPSLTVATDIIVGFPSETEEDFQRTLKLLEATKPDVINISRYSARKGTPASSFARSRSETLKDRSERLHEFAAEIQRERNSVWKGWTGKVLIDEINSNGLVQGRNFCYKPVVIEQPPDRKLVLGQEWTVRIHGFTKYSLKGSIS